MFATTALVMTAGVAAAEVSLSGSANMGIKYNETATQKTTLHHEIDFGISGSGTTDAGYTFGASVDVDTDNSSGTFSGSDGEVFFAGPFGRITVGKVDAGDDQYFGALEVGFDGLGVDDVAENGYGGGSHDVLYTNSIGDLSFAVSASSADSDDSTAVGFEWKGPVTIAVGYNDTGATNGRVTSVGVKGTMNAIGYNIAATDNQAKGNGWGVGVTYDMGAMDLQVSVADNDASTDTTYGVGMTYALGGGATFGAGIGSINGVSKADAGVNFSF